MSSPESRSSKSSFRRSLRLLAGMSNLPESCSSQFALRRSSRLLEKSSITKPQQRSRIKPRKPCKPRKSRYQDVGYATTMRNNDIEGFRRRCRKIDANLFRLHYSKGSGDNIMELKTYIYSGGISFKEDKSYGFTWVAVHGINYICVAVNMNTSLDVARLRGFIKAREQGALFTRFATSVICEIEDLADSSTESCQTFESSIKKPFAVVPMIPSTTDIEESGHEASTAVKFLQEKMKNDIAFTRRETVQIAISALQHVVHQKFKADDIWVSILPRGATIEHLQPCDLERHFAVINEPGSGGSGSSGSSARSTISVESDLK